MSRNAGIRPACPPSPLSGSRQPADLGRPAQDGTDDSGFPGEAYGGPVRSSGTSSKHTANKSRPPLSGVALKKPWGVSSNKRWTKQGTSGKVEV